MNKLIFLWSNAHQLFYMWGNVDSYLRYTEIPFNKAARLLQTSHGDKMHCYIGEEDLVRYINEGEMFLDHVAAKEYIRNAYAQCETHQEFFSKLAAIDFSQLTDKEILSYWRGLMDHYAHSAAYFRSTQEEPSQVVVETVMREVSSSETQKLMMSPELDVINEEAIAWDTLMKKGFTRKRASVHLQEFPWLFQNVFSDDETIDELAQRASDYDSNGTHDIRKQKEQLKEEQKEILARHPAITEYVKTLQALAHLRPLIKARWTSTAFYARPLLYEVSKRTGVELKTLFFYYRSEDVDALVEHGTILSEKQTAERCRATAYLIKDGVLHTAVGHEAEKMEEELLVEKGGKDSTELKGRAACPGKVQGIVHILTANDPIAAKRFRESFTEGILVTSMTQPNVVDIVRRASAVVTNEGGMLCHAAIISREFTIPCVVGTKHATQILKDGDLVEVDANNGTVRIL